MNNLYMKFSFIVLLQRRMSQRAQAEF